MLCIMAGGSERSYSQQRMTLAYFIDLLRRDKSLLIGVKYIVELVTSIEISSIELRQPKQSKSVSPMPEMMKEFVTMLSACGDGS